MTNQHKLTAFESALCKTAGDADYHRKGNEFCHNQNPDKHKVSEVLPLENFQNNASITKTHFSNWPFLELTLASSYLHFFESQFLRATKFKCGLATGQKTRRLLSPLGHYLTVP